MKKIKTELGPMYSVVLLFLGVAWGASCGVTAVEAAGERPSGAKSSGRPNVLFIVSDDLRDWAGAFGGNPDTTTPHIDRLCERGVAFLRAYTCAPLCNPTRVAVLNGRMPSSTGVYDNRQPFRKSEVLQDSVTLPQYFMQHGYYTAAAGKIFHMHFPDPVSWNDYDAAEDNASPAKKDRVSLASVEWGPVDAADSEMADARIANYCIAQLRKQHDKPLFLGCGFRKPHLPWYVPRPCFENFVPAKVTLPEVKCDDLDDVPPIAKKWAKPEKFLKLKDAGKWPDGVAAYLAAIHFMDTQLGRVLDALDASPYANNTIVVFWGDHGWHLGEKLHLHKSTLWEEADRAPLAFVVPGVAQPGGRCLRTVGFIDIYPTLLDLCGLPPKAGLEGVSLRPLLANPSAPWDRPGVTDFHYGNHSVRSERWRYTRYADGTEELYDHDADPKEWTNLAGDPSLAQVKKELARWMPKTETKDSPHQYFEGDKKKSKEEIDGE